MHVKMVFESYAVYVNGKEELRTDFQKAGKTYYRVYVKDEFVKELSFKPKPMALINAIAPGLDWKKIDD